MFWEVRRPVLHVGLWPCRGLPRGLLSFSGICPSLVASDRDWLGPEPNLRVGLTAFVANFCRRHTGNQTIEGLILISRASDTAIIPWSEGLRQELPGHRTADGRPISRIRNRINVVSWNWNTLRSWGQTYHRMRCESSCRELNYNSAILR